VQRLHNFEHRGIFPVPRAKKNKQAGAAFKELLKQRGFTQYKLEQATGLDKGLISRIATGETASPEPTTLGKIATALGIELGELTQIFDQSIVGSHSAEVPQPQEQAHEETPSKNTEFVGREEALNGLDNLVNEGAKVILIQAEGGVGKTTLAQKWFEHQGLEPLLLRVGMTSQNIQSAEDWVRHKLLNDFQENPERNFLTMLEQLRVKLQTQRFGVLIDNLEPALINGEFINPHQSYYVELLTVLAHPTVQSITLVTSREPLYEPGIMGLQTFQTYLLEGLKKKAWEKYFDSQNISTNINALSEMYRAYGGNALAMQLLSSDIRKQAQGNLEVYWQYNRDYLLKLRSLKSLVKRQFNKLREDNRQAYDLLCRLGFYPERDVPFVPNAWLRCLLWDVPEKHRQQVIDDLCDRSLVKMGDDGYYLHPVIRVESIERLNSINNPKTDYLLLIKEQIDLLFAGDQKIQDSLSWISKRFSRVSECYKQAAFRAFYLGETLKHILEVYNPQDDFNYNEMSSFLEKDFESKIYVYHKTRFFVDYWSKKLIQEVRKDSNLQINEKIINALKKVFPDFYKDYLEVYDQVTEYAEDISRIGFEVTISLNFKQEDIDVIKKTGYLEKLRKDWIQDCSNGICNEIINSKPTKNEFSNMLFDKDKASRKTFRKDSLFKNYKYSLDLEFSDEQKKLLKQYYDVNLLLVYCLDNASDIVRSHIEDTLLLPIAEIK
jgi:transcriptional regulator with XRE-family HTH domain